MFKNYKTSKRWHFASLGALFLFALIYNILTVRIADDFMYSLSFATGEHLSGIPDIIDSLIEHGNGVNGRYCSHFFAHLFLMLPDIVFDLVNSAVFVATIYMVYAFCNKGKEINNFFLMGIFGAIWLFELEVGQVNFWLDGACNYLWAVFFGLLFLLPYLNSLLYQKSLRLLLLIPHLAVSVLLGGYLEPLSVGFLFIAGVVFLIDLFYLKNKRALLFIPSLLGACAGLAMMAFAPAESINKISSFSLLKLLEIFGIALFVLARLFPLILLSFALFKRAKAENADKRLFLTVLVLAAGALVSNFILLLATNYPMRCGTPCIFLTVFVTALLFGAVKNRTFGKKTQTCFKLGVLALGLGLVIGILDTANTYVVLTENEAIVETALENGETHVELKKPTPLTKYNPLWRLIYLDSEDATRWPNFYVAKYYGLESIIGSS
ncbi:MAG: hypothetical protein IKJ35_05905 [Clostridia bacterium]|nr:hypothetical protein [Clostridia bacterium]